MTYDFETRLNLRGTGSAKWEWFEDGVLPMWVADMDFVAAPEIIAALQARVATGSYGYPLNDSHFKEIMAERMNTRHGLTGITAEMVIETPGLVTSLNLACRAYAGPGEGVMTLTPIYPPFLMAIKSTGRELQSVDLAVENRDGVLHYSIDFDALEAAVKPNTRLLLLCNPHNPIGRVYTRAELTRLTEFAQRHDLIICSDEIHCDLILEGEHINIASLSDDAAARTITLTAPSKTFNLPGLFCGAVIITDPEVRASYQAASDAQMTPHVNFMGTTAGAAAYTVGQPWLDELLDVLCDNRDTMAAYLREHLPQIAFTVPEGTYLAWLDCRALNLPGIPADFFRETGKVAFNNGLDFGPVGEGFVRFNFGCPKSQVIEALDRMRDAITSLDTTPR